MGTENMMQAVLAKVPAGLKISDLQTGFRILSRLPLANSQQAAFEISHFLDRLLQTPPAGEVYLQLLEQTRISLCFVAEELARQYVNKSLPLGDTEANAFRQVVAIWQKAARAYAHCAQLPSSIDGKVDSQRLAMILHRCIYYAGMVIVEHHRARQALPAGVWLKLHGYYSSAEEWGVATLAVPDSLDPLGRSSHCTAAFIALLLAELAGPYGFSIREMGLVRRWADKWSPLVSLHPVDTQEPLPELVVDLLLDCGLRSARDRLQAGRPRRIDVTRLLSQIHQIRKQLQLGVAPEQLGLGEDCSGAFCDRLLRRLHQPWSMSRAARKCRRHEASGSAKVAIGFAAIHYHISGKEFGQPEGSASYSREEFESLFAFRHMLDSAQLLEIRQAQLGFAFDTWQVLDESASGFRLLRSIPGRKFEARQLLSICQHNGSLHLLAQVVWLMQEQGGGLLAGIAALPGRPQAVAVRPAAQAAGATGAYVRAFMLPAVSSLGAEQSLILPPGWYRPERELEVYTERRMRVKLLRRVGDGADFERVSFVVL